MPTSSADPAKLHNYSVDGFDLGDQLRPKANTVDRVLQALASRGYPAALGNAHTRLVDLVGDWRHLDEFVADVADAFLRADSGGRVVTVDDNRLYALGRIGFADRDEAIAAAHNAAAMLGQLRREGADPQTIQNFITSVRAGQHDPAFAVAFSQRIGARGYAQAAALIRDAYRRNGVVPPGGIAAVKVLSTTLTTALDTLPDVPDGRRHDPDNATLPADERLGADFVRDLTGGYRPDPYARGEREPTPSDLSVVLRFAEPPTALAVAIANAHMTPYMRARDDTTGWGNNGSVVGNYATMLGRDSDAAAQWLGQTEAMELALARRDADDIDGGQGLADLVRSGLSHPDWSTREGLMSRAIDAVGAQREVPSWPMRGALAEAATHNMDLVARHAAEPWQAIPGGRGAIQHNGRLPYTQNTTIFLSELMEHPGAKQDIVNAVARHADAAIGPPPAGGGDRPVFDVRRAGVLLQVSTEAEVNIAAERIAGLQGHQAHAGKVFDYAVGHMPFVGEAYDAATTVANQSVGDALADAGAEDARQALRGLGHSRVNGVADRAGLTIHDQNALKAGARDVKGLLDNDEAYQDYTPDLR
jgi:hypothetical protein